MFRPIHLRLDKDRTMGTAWRMGKRPALALTLGRRRFLTFGLAALVGNCTNRAPDGPAFGSRFQR
jgi:hypothetical protein